MTTRFARKFTSLFATGARLKSFTQRETDIENPHYRTLWHKTSDHPRRHASCRLCRDGGCSVERRRARHFHRADAPHTPEALAHDIDRCRDMPDQPFGVNLTFLPSCAAPPSPEDIRAIVEGSV